MRYFYLISDVLFNTTNQNYRRLFARVIPFVVYQYSKGRDGSGKFRGELKALLQIWEIKFIFEDVYTKGLLFLLEEKDGSKVKGIHPKLKKIGDLEDEIESEV